MRRPSNRRPSDHRLALLLALLAFPISGCMSAVTLPGATIPGPGGVTQAPEPTVSTADASVVVLYYVQCRSCQVTYTTPGGMSAQDLEGGREFRAAFNVNRPGLGVTLQVTPDDGTAVNRARIRVGDSTLAEAGRGLTGDAVNLSAVIG